ncbi:MAG TPA: DUF190 domain-containing protein [Stellaceae bacterium]|nr:DUF190 domain-containing protein [Stellaceae bacterium]
MPVWNEAISLKIFISDDDTYDNRPLYEALVDAARAARLAGALVMRGITGYGRSGHIHETWHGFTYDLPVVVEFIDTKEKLEAFLPVVERLRAGALVIRQPVQILEPHGRAPAAA